VRITYDQKIVMHIKLVYLIILLGLFHPEVKAQSYYWIGFRDKANSPFSVSSPEKYLSSRSIQRRINQNIPINETDLPVNQSYITSIVNTGAIFIHSSKWLNGITVRLPIDTLVKTISKFGFIKEIRLSKPPETLNKSAMNKFEIAGTPVYIDSSYYGASVFQVGMMNGQVLHNRGFRGEGMVIAVLDAGFYKANSLPALNSLYTTKRILGTFDFVNASSNFYSEHSHGMMVLSTMGGNIPGKLIGTAPDASYWLLRTEDANSEYPVEEDYWVTGAEYADSVGADIINSSLGYSRFDRSYLDHAFSEMDGKTTRVARGANFAASKGMLVFASAGNEANNSWKKIISPSDGDSVIAVAAVNRYGIRAAFSSLGPSADKEIKPNLAAMGQSTVLQGTDGLIITASGTSFSSPVLAGMAACLWQAFPEATAYQVKKALIMSGSLYQHPDSLLGCGIPDMRLASALLESFNNTTVDSENRWTVFPNPFGNELFFIPGNPSGSPTTVEIYNNSGILVFKKIFSGDGPYRIKEVGNLPFGIWIMKISSENHSEVHKVAGGQK
jgi:serine protease AprX